MKKQTVPKQFTRALVDKKTINKDAKTFDVVFATETPVFRRHWEENFYEILSCKKENMRTERLDGGVVPLLDNHDKYTGVTKQYGSVVSWSIVNGECRATIQFSTRAEFQGIWDDIEAGVIKGISAAYIPWVYQREKVAERTEPNYRAIDWEVTEISLAPVPADYNSKVRNEDATFEIEIKNFQTQNTRSTMETENTEVVEQKPTTTPTERSNIAPATPVTVDEEKVRKEAIKAEKQRGIDIRNAVRAAKLEENFADTLIESGVSIDAARAQIIDKLASLDAVPPVRNNTTSPTASGDEKANVIRAMADALQHRSQPGSVELKDQAHDYKYMSMLDMARHCLNIKGEKAGRFSPSDVVKRAIAITDYPELLNSVVERTIRRTYDALQPEWKNIANKTTAKDFREKTGIAVDGKVTFDEVAEGGEYKHAALITNDSAKVKLKTFGRMIKITRQAIINDDLSVFDKLPKIIAYGAADFQAAKVWALITGNANTPDNVALFHTATHKNLAAAGAVISETSLSAARTALWKMKSPAGNVMPVIPKYLVVPIELQTTAEKVLGSLLASAANDINTMKDKLQIIVSPYLTSAQEWYVTGDPSRYEGLVYAYLEGEEGLFIDKEVSFENDSVTTKARLDFDCAVHDYRAWYKNPGAAPGG